MSVSPLYDRCGAATFCPWCWHLVRTAERGTHLQECEKRPSWLSVLPVPEGETE